MYKYYTHVFCVYVNLGQYIVCIYTLIMQHVREGKFVFNQFKVEVALMQLIIVWNIQKYLTHSMYLEYHTR